MKRKQVFALIAAAVVFVFVGVSNVFVQIVARSELAAGTDASAAGYQAYMEEILGFSSNTLDYESMLPQEEFVGVIPIVGTIQNTGSSGASTGYDHEGILAYIDALMDNSYNEAILLYEETPGGAVIDADELYLKLMEYKEETGRPVYAYMHNYSYSGGYYISMAADKIIANRNATTGSIGVIMSTYDLSGLYEKLGVREINITSGENKAMFTGDEQQTQKQIQIYQEIVDELYGQFLDIVMKGRNMTEEQLRPYADGRVFSAGKAKELGLIDEIVNTYPDAKKLIEEELKYSGILFDDMPEPETTLFEKLFMKIESIVPKSDNQVLEDLTNLNGKGLMYYAEP